MSDRFIAHRRESDKKEQSVYRHLAEVSNICGKLADKIDEVDAGRLIGLLHDFGKYSQTFQTYIQSATGILNPDADDEYVDAKALKGKIDHSTAGAQWAWDRFRQYGHQGGLVGQVLSVCLASHHGGMLDCLKPDGKNGFLDRMNKDQQKTHLQDCLKNADEEVINKLNELAADSFLREFWNHLVRLVAPDKNEPETIKQFRLGFFTRFLFSCLIDADRTNSADFENPDNEKFRSTCPVDWQEAINRLEEKLASFSLGSEEDKIYNINRARREISNQCRKRADDAQGIYTLTVPTGGGKTFASMRYALHHAKKHKLDHIIYIIPYTSIIEQNAEEVRKVLEHENDTLAWVLEHHSNLEPEDQTWHSKLVTENWDAPIIFTTMVQFLDVLFGGGTRGARRMHNIANSVLIFDEIQSLPVHCVHLFCNGIQFFIDHAGSTAILCTATQPLLDNLRFPDKGQLTLPNNHELVANMSEVFEQFKRVEICNLVKTEGWTEHEIGELMVSQLTAKGNCLVIVNTKQWARKLYDFCLGQVEKDSVFHLSTSLCPAHRKKVFNAVKDRLENELPVLCISTQLIEAGVDIDFNSVIRFLAGLDSIAQAAGRCNRNGKMSMAQVYVVNPRDEPIDMLPDIKEGRDQALRIFSEMDESDPLNPEIMSLYFLYYFYQRADLMDYPLTEKQAGRTDTLLSLLGDNHLNVGRTQPFQLRQSFKTAGNAFTVIYAPTQAVIVPYGAGKEIIAGLCADFAPAKAYQLLKQAQKYSVNVFPNVWEKLKAADAVIPVQQGEEIYYLDARYYSKYFGLSAEEVSLMEFQMC